MSTLRTLFLALPASAFLGAFPLAASTRIDDPVAFVRGVYTHYVAAQGRAQDYNAPRDIYTPRLSKLFEDDRKKAPAGEEGCLDFDYWVNGQDWRLTNIEVTEAMASQDRKVVVAKFANAGKPQEIHFEFRRIDGRWLLDDVSSLKDMPWTLSRILECNY
ncbi:MAG: DUF3828 domain-containing protein [Bryobacteraceae bacterium]|jgi:hypothetical protein